jgi:1,4-dihydroxy-2-naphthoyl-CoA hydrolase
MKYNGEIEFFIEEVNEKHVISRMPIKPGMLNPFGNVHAGAMIWLADATATVLALGAESIPEDGK